MNLTNNYNLPPSFFEVINKSVHDLSESDPLRIGVTTLISPHRMRLLQVRHWEEITEDASNHIWRILGIASHSVMENISTDDRLVETKLEEQIDGITLVGKLDLYEKSTKSIEDLKITSVFSAKSEAKIEWEYQTNCYGFFLRNAGYEVESAHINAILRDWRPGEAKKYPDYPPIPFIRKDILLWSKSIQEEYIRQRIKEYKIALELDDEELPMCLPEERWKREDEYKVYKNNNKIATKICASSDSAEEYIESLKDKKNKYSIKKFEGQDFRCTNYCICAPFCSYWREHYGK